VVEFFASSNFLSICRYPVRRFSNTAKNAVNAGGNLMGSPVVHFEITGNDGDLLKKFYGELFDWKIDSDNPQNYGMVASEEGGIGGGVSKAQQGPGMVTFYVATDDVSASLRARKSRSVSLPIPKETWLVSPRCSRSLVRWGSRPLPPPQSIDHNEAQV
jgi:predicted enzyme related to lactoylglutathione lyase